MPRSSKPGKLPLWLTILCLCIIILAGVYHAQKLFGFNLITENGLPFSSSPIDRKQELRAQFGEYREGRISARDMLKACLDKVQYAEKDAVNGKSALAEYIYALRSQVYLDQGNPQAALAEAQKAAAVAPSPGRGSVALGDALRTLGENVKAGDAYYQAIDNPGYIMDYTVEDPISSQTLDALFTSGNPRFWRADDQNVTVRGKFIGLFFDETGAPFFDLEASRADHFVICRFEEDEDLLFSRSGTPVRPGYGIHIAQAHGLLFATKTLGPIVTFRGEIMSFGLKLTDITNGTIIKIEH